MWYSIAMSASPGAITRSLVSLLDAEAGGGETALSLSNDLSRKKADRRLDFGFEYRGIPFVVRAEAEGPGTTMEIRASLGDLPYTAEDPERRMTALAILEAASGHLGGRIRLSRRHRVELVERFRFDEPLTPALLLTRTAELVLQAKPYLELLSLVVPPPLGRETTAAPATG